MENSQFGFFSTVWLWKGVWWRIYFHFMSIQNKFAILGIGLGFCFIKAPTFNLKIHLKNFNSSDILITIWRKLLLESFEYINWYILLFWYTLWNSIKRNRFTIPKKSGYLYIIENIITWIPTLSPKLIISITRWIQPKHNYLQ